MEEDGAASATEDNKARPVTAKDDMKRIVIVFNIKVVSVVL
jgi:hypothetical protein